MLIERLIEDNPALHEYHGRSTSWAVDPDTLRFIHGMLEPGMNTLETGCGQTTVVFAIAGTSHICITDDPGEVDRVRNYCRKLGLEDNINFIVGSSDHVLALDAIQQDLDYVFIDGAHRFPFPILDWHYTSKKLKVGGILALDDYVIPSVAILFDFLCADDNWDLLLTKNNTAYFKKAKEPDILDDWQGQTINLKYIEGKIPPKTVKQGKPLQKFLNVRKLLGWFRK